MFQGCYQRVLGLPDGILAPDYYQLLGVVRSAIDPQRIASVMEKRIASLDSAKSDDTELADYFRRELHRARAAGLTEAFTHNDGSNAPMLAVNDWLGYERCAAEWKYTRELTG